tara:strand:- start:286 stop:540 length:255 start_codon:yes stop_codon:yes gene_type:complete
LFDFSWNQTSEHCVWFQYAYFKLDKAVKLEGMLVQSDNRDDREKVIDENLRRVFDETLEEGIPDRFKELLSQLKKQESGEGSRG